MHTRHPFRSASVLAIAVCGVAPLAHAQLAITDGTAHVITFDASIGYDDGNANNDVLRITAAYEDAWIIASEPDAWDWAPSNTGGKTRFSTQAWSMATPSVFGPDVNTNGETWNNVGLSNWFVQNNSATGSNAINIIPNTWTAASLTLRVQNFTGATVSNWNIGFDLWSYGNFSANNATNLRLLTSTDNIHWTQSGSPLLLPDGPDATTPTSLGAQGAGVAATVLANEYLYVRLAYATDLDGAWSGGNGVLIDNLSIQADTGVIPEPSAFAALAGILALGASATRRCRRP